MGNHSARIYRHSFWRTAEPAEICQQDKRPISSEILDAIILNDFSKIAQFLKEAKRLDLKLFVVSCPPARKDAGCVLDGTRLEVVGYIDKRMKVLFGEFLKQENIDFITYPTESLTDDGFLNQKYYFHREEGPLDTHHANVHYGHLLLEKIMNYLET